MQTQSRWPWPVLQSRCLLMQDTWAQHCPTAGQGHRHVLWVGVAGAGCHRVAWKRPRFSPSAHLTSLAHMEGLPRRATLTAEVTCSPVTTGIQSLGTLGDCTGLTVLHFQVECRIRACLAVAPFSPGLWSCQAEALVPHTPTCVALHTAVPASLQPDCRARGPPDRSDKERGPFVTWGCLLCNHKETPATFPAGDNPATGCGSLGTTVSQSGPRTPAQATLV